MYTCMLILTHYFVQDELAAEKAKLSEYFSSAEGQPTSLYIQCTHRTIRQVDANACTSFCSNWVPSCRCKSSV